MTEGAPKEYRGKSPEYQENSLRALEVYYYKQIAEEFRELDSEEKRAEHIVNFVDNFQRVMRLKPVFEGGGDRARLATDPGLVISNHPERHIDIPTVLSETLKARNDFKVMVTKQHSDIMKGAFGSKVSGGGKGDSYIVSADNSPSGALDAINETREHVADGGVFMLFPSASKEHLIYRSQSFGFEAGFSMIIDERKNSRLSSAPMKDEDMIYSFYIHPEDIAPHLGDIVSRFVRIVASERAHMKVGPEELDLPEIEYRVDERYASVAQWRDAVRSGGGKVADNLTQFYLDLFGLDEYPQFP